MFSKPNFAWMGSLVLVATVAGCGDNDRSGNGVRQTKFPGQFSAGGGTSGDVIARAGTVVEGQYTGGTPGIAGGSGGNTGGAATGGTVQESGQGPSGAPVPKPDTGPGTQAPAGGTPGIVGGSGGNTGGAATAGTVQGPTSVPAPNADTGAGAQPSKGTP